MKFTWNIEEGKLMNDHKRFTKEKKLVYTAELTTTVEEKLDFLCEYGKKPIASVLAFASKCEDFKAQFLNGKHFICDMESAFAAWLDENDPAGIVYHRNLDGRKILGRTKFPPYRFIDALNIPITGCGYTHKNYVTEAFHQLLANLERQERIYDEKHNGYNELQDRLNQLVVRYSSQYLGKNIKRANHTFWVYEGSDKRKATIEELKLLISRYEKFESLSKELIDTAPIFSYEHKAEETESVVNNAGQTDDEHSDDKNKNKDNENVIPDNIIMDFFVENVIIKIHNQYQLNILKQELIRYISNFSPVLPSILEQIEWKYRAQFPYIFMVRDHIESISEYGIKFGLQMDCGCKANKVIDFKDIIAENTSVE